MISAQDITFSYASRQADERPKAVLTDCSLNLGPSQALAVMGPTGAGKSTLSYVLAGLAPRHTGGTLLGSVAIAGHDLRDGPPAIGSVGVLFQDAATQLFNTTVEDEVAWGLEAMGLAPHEIGQRVEVSLAHFELTAVRQRAPWALSGGQQKRLALAALWTMRPGVLILDEPLGGLDPEGCAEVLAAVDTLREAGTTLLIMTLQPEMARQAGALALLADGHLSSAMPVTAWLEQEVALAESGLLLPTRLWPDLSPRVAVDHRDPAIEVQGLRFRYPGGTEVLHGIDLTIPRGQFVALVGRNGAGKSTLVRHLNGLLRPSSGAVSVMGRPLAGRAAGTVAGHVGFLFQRPEQQLFSATVRDEIAYGPARLGLSDVAARVDNVLARFGLENVADVPPALLGYGAQRTVTLAVLAALATPIVVLDEPTVGLDGRGLGQLLAWVAELREQGVTIVLVTHDLGLAARADRVITLDNGAITSDDTPAEAHGGSA
ncbi:MAG: energy-coupling factor ABC transporter ATP-binding protein [Anaerolineae bacterium]|jgi:energy-coupling factor transport system ATP-binding protein|nr:energy-coupling factor ABC transporter ATP-binding protein [Anaerolineae bacterium]